MPVRYMYSDEADAAARIIQRWWTEIKVLSGVSLEVVITFIIMICYYRFIVSIIRHLITS